MPTFGKECRIRKRPDFVAISSNAYKIISRNFIILRHTAVNIKPRLGITVSKKVGNAVCRNRIKRLVREFYRINIQYFTSFDYVIIARTGAGLIKYETVSKELASVLTKFDLSNDS